MLKYVQPRSAGELVTEEPLSHWKDKHLLCCPWSDGSEVHFKIFQEFLVNWSSSYGSSRLNSTTGVVFLYIPNDFPVPYS